MKVLQISKFYPPVTGGIESVAFELTEGLNRRGISTDVLCAHTKLRTVREHTDGKYDIVRAGSFGVLLSTSMSPALIRQVRQMCSKYDVLHVHMPDPMAALALWLARPVAKIVLHWHSDVVNQRRALKFYEPLQNWGLKRADAIVATTSPYLEASKPLQAWKSKVEVIPLGITPLDSSNVSAKAEEIRQRYRNRKIVFSLGRMTYYKGFDVLIDAARSLVPDAVIVVGGGGDLLQSYRDMVAAKGLGDKIEFIGRIPDSEVMAYFEAASVFCLTSTIRAEAYGVVLLEAMAMGKPIVTTDIPGSGVPWVNQHMATGINVPVGDSAATAIALNRILKDTALAAQLGRAGRQRFETEFTATTMVDRTLALYRRLLGS